MRIFLVTAILMTLTGISVFADTYQCYGTEDNRGALMLLKISPNTHRYVLTASIFEDGEKVSEEQCRGSFDRNYVPRTKVPRYDRYTASNGLKGSCGAEYFWVDKKFLGSEKGFVSLEFDGGHPGDSYGYKFLCRLK